MISQFNTQVHPNLVEEIKYHNQPLERVVEQLMDGDIIIFQKDDPDLATQSDLPTAKDYYKYGLCYFDYEGLSL